MKKHLLFIALLGCSLITQAAERVKWVQGEEIILELATSKERKVVFPEKVRFAVKQKYSSMFKHSLLDSSFYITPVSSFNSEKLTLQGLESGRFYILEASVSPSSTKSDDDLIVHNEVAKSPQSNVSKNRIPGQSVNVTPIDLVQFASQHLYAPDEALIEPKTGIRRVAINQAAIPNLYRGGEFEATTLASWVGGGTYVTAVKLTNQTKNIVEFNPCNIRGDFYSSTPQFLSAFPAGSSKDFTVVYIISKRPFDVAVKSRRLLCV